MKKKVMFLFNPEAGNNAIEKIVFDIIKNLTIFDCEVTVFPIMPDKGLGSEEILINLHHKRMDYQKLSYDNRIQLFHFHQLLY